MPIHQLVLLLVIKNNDVSAEIVNYQFLIHLNKNENKII